jgi:hypothetical protein
VLARIAGWDAFWRTDSDLPRAAPNAAHPRLAQPPARPSRRGRAAGGAPVPAHPCACPPGPPPCRPVAACRRSSPPRPSPPPAPRRARPRTRTPPEKPAQSSPHELRRG